MVEGGREGKREGERGKGGREGGRSDIYIVTLSSTLKKKIFLMAHMTCVGETICIKPTDQPSLTTLWHPFHTSAHIHVLFTCQLLVVVVGL